MNLKEFFKTPEWEVIFKEKCVANARNGFGITFELSGYVIVKVTTNLKKNKYKCYFTDGDTIYFISPTKIVIDYPETAALFDKHNISYL